jgi:peptidoglycan-associated lipoprotein
MKNANLIASFFLSMTLAAGMTGCKHRSPSVTEIPGHGGPGGPGSVVPGPGPGEAATNPNPPTSGPIALDPGEYGPLFNGPHNEDRDTFKADTIYFDFDSSTIKASEESKLQDLANHFKDDTKMEGLIIEGNCDERGTEKYNLSLGERRALAAREYLSNLGVKPERLKTVTYGASHPLDPGHNESAWKQNRRDDFVLVTPK